MKNELEKLVLGIDIGGTYTKLGLVHFQKGIVEKAQVSMKNIQHKAEFMDLLVSTIDTLKGKSNFPFKLEGIGIGTPGVVNSQGIIEKAANISFLEGANLVEFLMNKFDLPVALTKDSNLAALGEGQFGIAKRMKNYIFLTLGTGLGCAVTFNGKLIEGNSGLAGEFGHAIIKENGRMCGCGRQGCLEAYVSGKGIVRTAFELLANRTEPSLVRDISYNKLTPKILFDLAQKGDRIAIEAFEQTGKILGDKIADLFTLLDPEAVILAGGLIDAQEFLMPAILERVEKRTLYFLKNRTNVFTSNLGANEAALLGAANLIWNKEKVILT